MDRALQDGSEDPSCGKTVGKPTENLKHAHREHDSFVIPVFIAGCFPGCVEPCWMHVLPHGDEFGRKCRALIAENPRER